MNEDYSFLIEDMVWSFSRLSSFYQCPYAWKMAYIDCVKGENNFFAEYGSHIHGILEKFSKGEAEIYELSSLYEDEYKNAIVHNAPPNKFVDLNQSYYDSGLAYLDNFEGFGDFKIIGVEKEINFKINNIKVKGYIDLLVEDKDGNLHIIDHKSSDPKSAKSEKAKEYWKQMTLYAIGVYNEYGKYPVKLHINAFRKQQWFTVDFNINQAEEVKKWVIDTVDKITKEVKYAPLSDKYFCNFLCNYRNCCEYKG
jgi:RecB family exonuclease